MWPAHTTHCVAYPNPPAHICISHARAMNTMTVNIASMPLLSVSFARLETWLRVCQIMCAKMRLAHQPISGRAETQLCTLPMSKEAGTMSKLRHNGKSESHASYTSLQLTIALMALASPIQDAGGHHTPPINKLRTICTHPGCTVIDLFFRR